MQDVIMKIYKIMSKNRRYSAYIAITDIIYKR
jgi:hypothetical protein